MEAGQKIEIEILQAGESELRGDSEWVATFAFTAERPGISPSDRYVKALAQIVLCRFNETTTWFEPKLEECFEVSPGKWRVRIRQPYVDDHHPIWWTG
jgi:hypothetical protein